MTVPALQALAEVFTERLLNTAVEGVVLAGLAWILLRLVGRQNSGTRFAVWFSTLMSIAALPLLSGSILDQSHAPVLSVAAVHGFVLSSSWARYLFAAWCSGAALLLVRLVAGMRRVRNLRKNCTEVDLGSDLAGIDSEIIGALRGRVSRRTVKVCVSNDVAVPAALGFLRPAIVFPAGLLPRLSPAEIEVILLHELAHLRRWDDWTNLAQKILKALFFFHPAVWWIESRLTLEREMACDDMVLAQTGSPRAYASSLISFAEKLQSARALALAQALVSRMHQMSLRVAQILDAKRSRRTGLWKPVVSASFGLLALVFGSAPYMPRLVAFQSTNPQTQIGPAQAPTNASRSNTAAFVPVVARQSEQRSLMPHAKAIQAAFHPRTSIVPPQPRATQHKPVIVQTKVVQREVPLQETIFILRTTGYDAFGAPASRVWTLCIWTINGKSMAESTMVSGSI